MSSSSQASQRLNSLLDENSFVEIGANVTARSTDFNMEPKESIADGVVTGYGLIDGRLVYVYSQDSAVLGGSVGEMHAKKIVSLYRLALKVGAPVIGLIDSAGLRLNEATDALSAFGKIYRASALASGVIPQITAVFGKCGGGLSLLCGMSDLTFMEEKDARLFVNSPNALCGNYEEKNDTSASAFQAEEAGNVDVVASEAFKNLEKEMDLAYKVVKLGRSSRNSANIKNRQPLSEMLISEKNLPEYYSDIVKEELNVKKVVLGKCFRISSVTSDGFKKGSKSLG